MFKLQTRDFLKGLVVSVLSAVIVVIQTSLSAGTLSFNWKEIGTVALSAAVAYLGKNLFTDDVKEAKSILTEHADKTQQTINISPKN